MMPIHKNRAEQNALREYPRCDECKVTQLTRVDAADLGEDLSEHDQPQHRLHSARYHLGRITHQLEQLDLNDRGTFTDKSLHLLIPQPRRRAVRRVWATSRNIPLS